MKGGELVLWAWTAAAAAAAADFDENQQQLHRTDVLVLTVTWCRTRPRTESTVVRTRGRVPMMNTFSTVSCDVTGETILLIAGRHYPSFRHHSPSSEALSIVDRRSSLAILRPFCFNYSPVSSIILPESIIHDEMNRLAHTAAVMEIVMCCDDKKRVEVLGVARFAFLRVVFSPPSSTIVRRTYKYKSYLVASIEFSADDSKRTNATTTDVHAHDAYLYTRRTDDEKARTGKRTEPKIQKSAVLIIIIFFSRHFSHFFSSLMLSSHLMPTLLGGFEFWRMRDVM
jgi:hypothetical protein